MLPALTFFLVLVFTNALVIPNGSTKKRSSSPLKIDFTVDKNVEETVSEVSARAQALAAQYSSSTFSKRYVETGLTGYRDVTYLIDFQLGSNKQQIQAILDTGSSDLWVNGPKVEKPVGGVFNPSKSSKNKKIGEDFFISYLDKSYASGEYVTDEITVGENGVLEDFQFAVVNKSVNNSHGVFGIADRNQLATNVTYDNFPWALQKAGITPKASYSLFLGSQEEKKGSIIFGGIDTEKYEGKLTTYPVEGLRGLALNVKSAEIAGQTIEMNNEVLLDSGTSLNLWPQNVLDAVVKELKGKELQGLYIVDCNQPLGKYMTFDFGKNKIKISYEDFVWKSEGLCVLGVMPSINDTHIFGDVFLRSAYVYYDLSERQISIAQAKYSNSSNIIEA